MKVYAITDVGKVRPINEDSYYVPADGEPFCAVADGMGGHNAGEVASAMAIQTFADTMREYPSPFQSALRDALTRANTAIYAASQEDAAKNGMGTTMTALCQRENKICIAHVGDSRAYLIRNYAIMRMTTDHTVVEEMILNGTLTPKQAETHPYRHYLTRAIGTAPHVEVDIVRFDIQEGDIFLLCSDGLYGAVEEHEILNCVLENISPEQRLQHMLSIALERGGHDNITALLVMCGKESA